MPTYAPQSTESVVFDLLLDGYPAQLSVDELAREVGEPVETTDAVQNLVCAGLAHRAGDHVWLTRPAWLCAVLLGEVNPGAATPGGETPS